MAFSVDAWGQPPVQPIFPAHLTATIPAPVAKLQLTPTQDIETTLISKWLPVIVAPTFPR